MHGYFVKRGKTYLYVRVHESTLIIHMKNQPIQDEFLTPEEVARVLKVKIITVYRMARNGRIPAVKFGKVWRINAKLLKELREGKPI